MPRKPLAYSRSDVKSAIALMESIGKVVTAIKFHPDGTFRVMTADHAKSAPSNDNRGDATAAWMEGT